MSAALLAAGPQPESPEDLAASVMSKLILGDANGAVASIHEPMTYSETRQIEDRRAIAKHLSLLLREFGAVSAPHLVRSVPLHYTLEVAGGDAPYWQSLQNFGVAFTATYLVHFSRAGPGVVDISLTRNSGFWELRSIALGLAVGLPQSRATMMLIGRTFLGGSSPSMSTENIEQTLNAMFGASESLPR